MAIHGKRYRVVAESRLSSAPVEVSEALKVVKETATAKFDESVDVVFKLGVDPRKSDQQVRGTVTLPHGTGRSLRVAVIAKGDKSVEGQNAGADTVGAEDIVEKIDGGWGDFDVLVATPDMMKLVGRLGKKLGPRMPNAKSGTVTMDIEQTVRDLKRGKIEYRTGRGATVQAIIGKASFTEDQLRENFLTLLDAVVRSRPAAAKGQYLQGIVMSATMGPGIKVDPQKALTYLSR
ncbi:MAG: 50S ribosomal protein L1 [Armatimonadetes bacterium CG2_30_59_28]|nr:50S ribosomal protein L1 [Armatimonadota bacterium]OIO92961.1 MAG: 50S ribosomal protein L1 [Armatimonadetes bacterium CG2_30_59_28]PIU65052.1 MAG: 50S ribosomal protein L1 [Armatimonadetes bacterium CG07_land_8_20_14_0_80_59_28]PIY43367.1 MAG: 50S ribosomal protein L1 [Armatimonadetes bacterium CG_4_10_14_3_um_filter_59_10]PJB74867.1 MAG: 50S ribosomal protein L1 [Armatimonadetes bacterium CG_4_9_14_3_um_filter_58_7]